MDFETWFEELKKVYAKNHFHKSAIESLDKKAFRVYFDEGLTPAQTYKEDLKHHQD